MMNQQTKNGWLDFLVSQQYTHAVTFKPNPDVNRQTVAGLHRLFVKVHMRVDRAILRRRFLKPSRVHLRSHAIGIVEGVPFNGHLHGAFRIAPGNFAQFEQRFADATVDERETNIWRKLMPNGTCDVVRINGAERWHSYTMKHVWQTDDTDRMIFLPLQGAAN